MFCTTICHSNSSMENMSSDSSFSHAICFDEDVFHASGFVSTQKTRNWGTKNPREIQQHESQRQKLVFQSAVHANDLLARYWFNSTAATRMHYYQMMNSYVLLEVLKFPKNSPFQQDLDPALNSTALHSISERMFSNSVIGRYCEALGYAKVVDLTAL